MIIGCVFCTVERDNKNMKQVVENIVFKLYKLINHFPFNNKRKGKIKIQNDGAILWHCRITSYGVGNHLILRDGAYINCEFIFHGNNNTIEIGKNCRARNASFFIEDDNNAIIIADHVNFAGKIHIAVTESTKCSIGNNCLFSSEIVIRTGDSHSVLNEVGKRINYAKNVVIDNHVWVGDRVLITKGVRIPENCIIGTGAVVTKPIEKGGSVIAGVPAKIVKENINWCSERL